MRGNVLKYSNRKNKQKTIGTFVIVFYVVGLIGMLLPSTFSLFQKLIPFALIVSFVALALFHKSTTNWKFIFCLLSIYIFSFIIEAIGVETGKVFGFYEYGKSLGLKLFQTPLIIGINWLFLVYTSSAIVERLKISTFGKIVLASLLMLLFDIILEQVAPKIEMWHWKDDIIPLQNYVAWFTLAVIFHSLLKVFRIKIENKLALLVLGCQFLFFFFLYIGLH